jgi:hypothetical protein
MVQISDLLRWFTKDDCPRRIEAQETAAPRSNRRGLGVVVDSFGNVVYAADSVTAEDNYGRADWVLGTIFAIGC